jgi:23S rRNA pseudouridine1911/1915/1917 synthase
MQKPAAVNQNFFLKEPDVVYLDNHLLVVNKPPGLLVQPDKEGSASLEEAAKSWLKQKFNKPGNVFATACHRLDRPVGGLVVLARTSKALARMNALFQGRDIRKVYLAVVSGKPEQKGSLRHWIKKNEATNKVRVYTYERGDAKQADLSYQHLQTNGEKSLLMVRLFTGRHHQIRAQLGFSGLPILGDSKYGQAGGPDASVSLYSYAMEFVHPVSGEWLRVGGKMPDSGFWAGFLKPDEASLNAAFAEAGPAIS